MIVLKNKSNFLINRNNNDDILDVSWKKQDKSKRVNKTSSTIHFLELSWYWTDLRMNKKSGLIIREEWFDVEQCHTQNAFISFFELESGLILIMTYFHNETFMTRIREIWSIQHFIDFSINYQDMSSDIGLFGLSPRANNLAVNLALKGVSVTVGNRSSDMVQMIISKWIEDKRMYEIVWKEGSRRVGDWSKGCELLKDIVDDIGEWILFNVE